jgi:hypothetical protein
VEVEELGITAQRRAGEEGDGAACFAAPVAVGSVHGWCRGVSKFSLRVMDSDALVRSERPALGEEGGEWRRRLAKKTSIGGRHWVSRTGKKVRVRIGTTQDGERWESQAREVCSAAQAGQAVHFSPSRVGFPGGPKAGSFLG